MLLVCELAPMRVNPVPIILTGQLHITIIRPISSINFLVRLPVQSGNLPPTSPLHQLIESSFRVGVADSLPTAH